MLDNPVRAEVRFTRKYENNIVNWKGYFVESKEMSGLESWFEPDHAQLVVIKMDPSESLITPDLVLTANKDLKKTSGNIIKNLKKGDEISFTAKLIEMGNSNKLTHGHVIKVDKTGNYKNLDDIVVMNHHLPTALPEGHETIKGEYE